MQRSTISVMNLAALCGSAAVFSHAFHTKKQFYPSMVYISNSGVAMMFVYFQVFVIAVNCAKIFQSIFFGRLRTLELEHIYDKSWFAVTETCLAMTIFRDEFTAKTAAEFSLLLMVKMFHWLVQDRVAFMEQTPNITRVFHARMLAVSGILAATDAFLVYSTGTLILEQGPSMALLFGFEYMVLLAVIIATFFKYILQCIDLQAENGWDGKAIFVFYADLALDFVKLAVYLVFFVVVMNFYGLPLHIIRDLCATFRSFAKRLHDFVQSRKATRLLDKYPEATAEQIAQVDSVCVICRDEMEAGTGVKRLPCGHIFHQKCLRTWLHQQQICAICRADVLEMDQNHARHLHRHPDHPPAPAAPAADTPAPAAHANNGHGPAGGQAQGAVPPTPHAAPPAAPAPAVHAPPPAPAATTPAAAAPPVVAGLPSLPPSPFGVQLPSPGAFGVGLGPHFPPPPPPLSHHAFGLVPPAGFVPFNFTPHVARPMELLSDAELHVLEGTERQKVLQRIEFLRQFRAEADAFMARFGQYEQLYATATGSGTAGGTAPSPLRAHLSTPAATQAGNVATGSPGGAPRAVGDAQLHHAADVRADSHETARKSAMSSPVEGPSHAAPAAAQSGEDSDARDVIRRMNRSLAVDDPASDARQPRSEVSDATSSDLAVAPSPENQLESQSVAATRKPSDPKEVRERRLRHYSSKEDVAK
eukprot:m.452383 g.452383  ORF g.452383 m.452383 type:complete len:701 (+) comp21540_c0_seq1:124-2226(+)